MREVRIKIVNQMQETCLEVCGTDEASLVYRDCYQEGDKIVIDVDETNAFYWISVDGTIAKSLVYLTGEMQYEIPFGDKKLNLSPNAFVGDRNLVYVRRAYPFEINAYRNLACNPNDQHGLTTSFPHATANVETRGESVFAAMNAIDGVIAPYHHGRWPYQSWGINQRPDAEWTLDFGRTVSVDRVVVYLRADFPHDNWWEQAKLTFSDGTEMLLPLEKGGHAQTFTFEPKKISWLKLSDLKKADDPSPFPALTQVEVYGTEI